MIVIASPELAEGRGNPVVKSINDEIASSASLAGLLAMTERARPFCFALKRRIFYNITMGSNHHKRNIQYSSDEGFPWEADAKNAWEVNEPPLSEDKPANNFGELIFGKTLKWYTEMIVWPMFILLILEIGIRVIQSKYLETLNPEIFNWTINAIRLILFISLALSAVRQFGADKKQAMLGAVLGGLLVGVILAVFQLFWYLELWAVFNLIGQPLLLAAEGLLVSWLFLTLFKNLIIKK